MPMTTTAISSEPVITMVRTGNNPPMAGNPYELTGAIDPELALAAFGHLRSAGERWRIPFEVVDADPADIESWRAAMVAAGEAVLAS